MSPAFPLPFAFPGCRTCAVGSASRSSRGYGSTVAFQARPVFAAHEVADALLNPAAILQMENLILLRRRVADRGVPAHLQRESIAVLAGAQRDRVLGLELVGKLECLVP